MTALRSPLDGCRPLVETPGDAEALGRLMGAISLVTPSASTPMWNSAGELCDLVDPDGDRWTAFVAGWNAAVREQGRATS